MDDLIRLMRRLSRQGVPTGATLKRLRHDRDAGLTPDELHMLRKLADSDDVLLTGREWRILHQHAYGSPFFCAPINRALQAPPVAKGDFFPVPLAHQWLRSEPETVVHHCGDGCRRCRLPLMPPAEKTE